MSTDAPSRGSPPNLSRVQVYLYGVLALFAGVLFAGVVRSLSETVLGDQVLLVLVGGGVLLGGAFALAAVVLVVRAMRGLPAERRYRLSRLHTIALTVVVVLFLSVATVRPSLVAPPTASTGLVPPSNVAAAVPLAAGATTLVALAVAYRRLNRPPAG